MLQEKIDKADSTDRPSASSCPNFSQTHKNTNVAFLLNKAVNQWLREFC